MTKELDLFNGYTPALPEENQLNEVFKRIADFKVLTNKKPDAKFIEKTPDNRADALVISYVENRLDELYSGLWSTTNFRYQVIANEVCGSITLKVFHPKCGVWLEREGAAAIQIKVDKVPDNLTGQSRNEWALSLANKKPNSLQMDLPRLKAECLKNAAKSIGVTFGRDLNRKKSDQDYNPDVYDSDSIEVRESIISNLESCSLPDGEKDIIRKYAEDSTTPLTRLENILNRVIANKR